MYGNTERMARCSHISRTMSEPFFAPHRRPPTRQAWGAEHLWTIQKERGRLSCELHDHGEAGVEVQVYHDREFLYGLCYKTRALALEQAETTKAQYLGHGGVLIVE